MPIPDHVLDAFLAECRDDSPFDLEPKRGDAIFDGTDYPREWSWFVGQEKAKEQLQVQIASAHARNTRLEHTLLASGTHGIGKGQPLDAKIATPGGWRPIGDLKPGDYVIGSDGLAIEVWGTFDRGELETYRVTFSDHTSLVVDGEHLWSVQRTTSHGNAWRTRSTDELRKELVEGASLRIPQVSPVVYANADLPIQPYILGLLLANGHLANTPSFTSNDYELIENALEIAPELGIHESTSAKSTARRFNFQNFRDALRGVGLYGKLSAQKFIPAQYLTASVQQREMLLMALLDCDGSVRVSNGQPLFHTTSEALAAGVKELVESLGGIARTNFYDRAEGKSEWRVSILLRSNPFSLGRKASLWQPPRKLSRVIKSIEPDRKSQIRCLWVNARDQLYVTENYIVTHNTSLATLATYKAGAGFVQTSGQLTAQDALRLMRTMKDQDVLFYDEIHQLVLGNRNRGDWLLPWMTEGKIYTERGAQSTPNITLIAATTDVGKLPQTLISRFMVQPMLIPYTSTEGAQIAQALAGRMGIDGLVLRDYEAISRGADQNPRVMRQILTAVRDLNFAHPDRHPNLEKALEWSGVSADGLSQIARDILTVLAIATDNTASLESIKSNLAEPGPIGYHEKPLLQRNLMEITGRGRKLTPAGLHRAKEEILSRR